MAALARRSTGTASAIGILVLLSESPAGATLRYGDIQISGNVSAQQLVRLQSGNETFSAFQPVQQRNTLRLQYEHVLVKDGGNLLDGVAKLPFIRSANFFAYYRFVYDSVYDFAPGPALEAQDGSSAGKFEDIPGRARKDIAFENVLREVFLDFDLQDLPISFRIGRQQVVWGEALSFRALDSVNALDVSWHLQQEAGLFGKVGFDELRIPAWTIKALVDMGSIGPLSNVYLEVFDIPFDFNPAYARFLPESPWSIPLRRPFRGGLAVDVGQLALGVPSGIFVQPCFDDTGNPQPNAEARPDFSTTAETGFCPSAGKGRTRLSQGLYDRRDPADVNQVGGRFGANAFGVGFTLNYIHRRHLGADLPGAAAAKAQVGAVNGNPAGFIQPDLHPTTDPITRRTTSTIGYLRIPLEFYYPYVHVVGASANYFEEYTGAVFALEAAWTHGFPIATLDPHGNGQNRKEVILGAFSFDRPTWIRALNRRSTWLIVGQLDFNVIVDHEKIRRIENSDTGQPQFTGDVGLPNSCLIPEQFRGNCSIDELRQFEALTLLVATTFYRGGSVAPLLAWINDWTNAPSMAFIVGVDYLATPNFIVTPTLAIYTNFGRTVDEPYGLGRLSQWDELRLKLTYQF